jgi:hypothetical protein
MVAKLLHCVGQRWIFDETVIGGQEMLESLHGKEQPKKTFQEIPPSLHINVVVL